MAKKIIIGIDIGSTTTRVVVTEMDPRTNEATVLGVGMTESRGLRHGYIINPAEAAKTLRKAIAAAEANAGMKIKRAIVAVGGISLSSASSVGSTIISRADTEVTALDVDKAIKASELALELANARIIYSSPIQFKVDGKEVLGRPEGMRGVKLEVRMLYVTYLAQHLEDMQMALLEAGIEILDIIPSAIAASKVLLSDKQKTVGVALVNIGSETVSIAVFENTALIDIHVFSIGSTDITNDIALGLRVPLEEAEGIKIGSILGNYPKKKLDEIIEARLSDIFELVENRLRKLKRNELLPAGIVLTGGGASLPMVEDLTRHILKLPVRIGTGELSAGERGKIRDATWFVAYGLTLMPYDGAGLMEKSNFSDIFSKIKSSFVNLFSQFRP